MKQFAGLYHAINMENRKGEILHKKHNRRIRNKKGRPPQIDMKAYPKARKFQFLPDGLKRLACFLSTRKFADPIWIELPMIIE